MTPNVTNTTSRQNPGASSRGCQVWIDAHYFKLVKVDDHHWAKLNDRQVQVLPFVQVKNDIERHA